MNATIFHEYLRILKSHVSYTYSEKPFMATYTTQLSNRLKAKFTLVLMFKKFVTAGTTMLQFRESYRSPVCWAIEESENSVHVHALYDTWVALRTHQALWNTIGIHDVGRVHVSSGEEWENYIDYIHKSFDHMSRFFGHFEIIDTVHLSNEKLI